MSKTSVQKKGQHTMNFSLPMSYTVTMLCWAYIINDELYESMGLEEKIHQEIRWASEYFIKCHREKKVYYFQAMDGSLRYSFKEAAELTDIINYSLKLDENNPISIIAAEPAAALAAASRAFFEVDREFSQLCLNHAKDLMELAESVVHKNQTGVGIIKEYEDKFLWACLWIFIASGELDYLNKALHYGSSEAEIKELKEKEGKGEERSTNCKDYEDELNELLSRFADGGVFEKMFNEWKNRHKRFNKNNSSDANGASETADKMRMIRMTKPRDNVEYLVGKKSIDVAAEITSNEETVKLVEFYANGEKFEETKKKHHNLYQCTYEIPASSDNSEIEVKFRAKAILEGNNSVKSEAITVFANVTDETRRNRIEQKKLEEQRLLTEDAKEGDGQTPFPFHTTPLPDSIKEETKQAEAEQKVEAQDEDQTKEQNNLSKDQGEAEKETAAVKEELVTKEPSEKETNHSNPYVAQTNMNFWEPIVGQPVSSVQSNLNQRSASLYQTDYATKSSKDSDILSSSALEKPHEEKIKVELICEESKNHDILCAMVKLKNISKQEFDLSKMKVRYYYSKSRNNPTCKVDQAGLRTGKAPFYSDMIYAIECQSQKSDSFIAGADYYVEASFKYNQMFATEHMLNLQFRLQSASVNEFYFVNDYSFDKAARIIILYDGEVLEGIKP